MYLLRHLIRGVLHAAGEDGGASGGGGDSDTGAAGSDGGGDASSAADHPEVEQRAREMGWSPREQWRGNPDNWIDASTFVQRGEQVLPILQANLRQRDTQLITLRRQSEQQARELLEAKEAIQVLTNISTEEARRAAKEKRRELLRQQAQARTDGDAEAEIELGEQIADITVEINQGEAQGRAGGKKPGTKAAPRQQQPQTAADGDGGEEGEGSQNDPTKDPAYQTFKQQNTWFGTDHRRTALAVAIGQELRADPANNHLQGKAFFDKVVNEVNRTIAPPRSGSKVEGGATGGNGANGGGTFSDPTSGKTYNDLPLEAKNAFERQAKLVVGEGKAFKTKSDWLKYYLQSYFNA